MYIKGEMREVRQIHREVYNMKLCHPQRKKQITKEREKETTKERKKERKKERHIPLIITYV
jgi:hypothetical protein